MMFERLELSIGGFFAGQNKVSIWIENKTMLMTCAAGINNIGLDTAEEAQIEAIPDDERDIFLEEIEQLKIYEWESEYVDPDILDGTQWELIYKEKGKDAAHIFGSNAYPEAWDDFKGTLWLLCPDIIL